MHDVIYAGVKRAKGESGERVGAFTALEGTEFISDAVLVDQTPIGRTPRINPVTYLKAFDPIRELFAATKDARSRGLTASHFSFNVPGGRCEACEGEGEVRVEMQFLADVFVPCDQCDGRRFKPQVLEVNYRGRNIHQVLDLTVREALAFFSTSPKVLRRLQVLDEIGLGYLRLGQPATTLSGGEAQRIKIASHLARSSGERLLYVLDEPTTGLHFDDIAKLLGGVPQAARSRATRCWSSSTTSTSSRRPTTSSTSGRRAARPAAKWSRPARRSRSRRMPRRTRDGFLRRCWLRAARMPMREDKMTKRALVGLAVLGWLAAAPLAAQTGSDALIDALKNPSTRTRIDALHSLGDAARAEAVVPMAALLLDGNDDVQFAAIESLLKVYIVRADLAQRPWGVTAIGRTSTLPELAFEAGPLATIPAVVPGEVLVNLCSVMRQDESSRIRFAAAYALGVSGRRRWGR